MAAESANKPEQQFFDDPALDRLMGVVMALAMEHAVLRDRFRALESQLEDAGRLDRDALDAPPSPEELARISSEQSAFVEALLQPLLGEQQSKGASGRFSLKRGTEKDG